MDAGALANEIADILGFPVGLRWKTIDTGVWGKISTGQKSRAPIVEVDTKNRFTNQRALLSFYSHDKKNINNYPNGIRLRFVKQKKDCVNAKEKAKVDKLVTTPGTHIHYTYDARRISLQTSLILAL